MTRPLNEPNDILTLTFVRGHSFSFSTVIDNILFQAEHEAELWASIAKMKLIAYMQSLHL